VKSRIAVMGAAALIGGFVGALMVTDKRILHPGAFSRVIPAIVLWIAFFTYWGIASKNEAPTSKKEPPASTVFHQFFLGIALLLLLMPIPGLFGRFLPESYFLVGLGAAIQAGFILLAVWARRHLGRNWSAEVRIAVDHELVRTGPYQYLRHPIYTSMLGMFLGTAISSGELHSLVAVVILSTLYWRKTRLEERILQDTFGREYDIYRRGTWALVPLVF